MNEITPVLDGTLAVSAGLIAMILLELLKLVVRKFWVKNPEYDFPPYFYNTMIPFLTALLGIGLPYIGIGEPVVVAWQTLLNWLLAVIVTLGSYYLGLAPLKSYSKAYKYKHL